MSIEESALYKRWLGNLWGYRRIVNAIGDALPERAKIKVLGILAYDDPSTSSTVLELSGITAAQHGNLVGGALHAIATAIAAGFMSAADKIKSDAATPNATASTLAMRDADGDLAVREMTAVEYKYTTPITVTDDEPVRVIQILDPVNGWSMNDSVEPEANVVSLEWVTEMSGLPHGSTLKTVSVIYTPNIAHVNLPNDQPALLVGVIDEGGVITVIGVPVQDNAANITEYNQKRTLTWTAPAATIVDGTQRYVAVFYDEESTNSLPGTKIHRPARWSVEKGSV